MNTVRGGFLLQIGSKILERSPAGTPKKGTLKCLGIIAQWLSEGCAHKPYNWLQWSSKWTARHVLSRHVRNQVLCCGVRKVIQGIGLRAGASFYT